MTGGGGFIGSHLVDRLLTNGHDVVVLDNFSTGRAENLRQSAGDPRLAIHEVDVAAPGAAAAHIGEGDWVFHLAALADIVPSVQRPIDYHRANVDGTVAVLEAARAAGAARFVYAASSSCYGIPDDYPTPETAELRPAYPYALTKAIGEQYVLHWAQVYRLPAVSLRFFNVYGPRARTSGTYGAVMGVFLAQKLAGQPFTVVGDGEQARDFTFVADVVDACDAAARSTVAGRAFNVGSGRATSVNRLVELLGCDAGVVNLPKRPGEPDCTLADVTRIRAELGWEARVTVEEGIAVMLEHIDHWRDAPVWDPRAIEAATADWFHYLTPRS